MLDEMKVKWPLWREKRIRLGHTESTESNTRKSHYPRAPECPQIPNTFSPTVCNAVLMNTSITTLNINLIDLLVSFCSIFYSLFSLSGPTPPSFLSLESKGYLLSSTFTMLPKQPLKHTRTKCTLTLFPTPRTQHGRSKVHLEQRFLSVFH